MGAGGGEGAEALIAGREHTYPTSFYWNVAYDAARTRESMQQKPTIPVLALGGDACLEA